MAADETTRNGQKLITGIGRRDFLRLGAAASAGLATGLMFKPQWGLAAPNETSRVVVVRDENVLIGSAIQTDIVRIMLDIGLQTLTDTNSPAEAWQALLPDLTASMRTAIKVNLLSPNLPSHPEVAYTIAASLSEMPVGTGTYPENQIVIWDRLDSELISHGYTINNSSTGVRCYGTNHTGIGYNPIGYYINGSYQLVSRCYTDHSDQLINLAVLKNHTISGVTFALKNQYGSVNFPQGMHETYCNPYIPALNRLLIDTYGDKQKLCICDAIMGNWYGGPTAPPNMIYNGLVLSQDPVALDMVCRDILIEHGCTTTWMATHIETASQDPYNLGNSNPADIERIDIENPSAVDPEQRQAMPRGITLGANYPEPFNSSTIIPLELDRRLSCRLDLYDIQGRRIRTLHEGQLSPGRHQFDWNGRTMNGRRVSAGRYIIRLSTKEQTHSRAVTYLP